MEGGKGKEEMGDICNIFNNKNEFKGVGGGQETAEPMTSGSKQQ